MTELIASEGVLVLVSSTGVQDGKDEFYPSLTLSFSQLPPTPSITGKQLYMMLDAQCSS